MVVSMSPPYTLLNGIALSQILNTFNSKAKIFNKHVQLIDIPSLMDSREYVGVHNHKEK